MQTLTEPKPKQKQLPPPFDLLHEESNHILIEENSAQPNGFADRQPTPEESKDHLHSDVNTSAVLQIPEIDLLGLHHVDSNAA
jgi:hypothetical protein